MVLNLETFSSQELPPVTLSSSQLCTMGLAAVQGLPQISAKCRLLVPYHMHTFSRQGPEEESDNAEYPYLLQLSLRPDCLSHVPVDESGFSYQDLHNDHSSLT